MNFSIFKTEQSFRDASDEDVCNMKKWICDQLKRIASTIELNHEEIFIGVDEDDRSSTQPELYVLTIFKGPSKKQILKMFVYENQIIKVNELLDSSYFVKQNVQHDQLKGTPFDLDDTYSLITDPVLAQAKPFTHSGFEHSDTEDEAPQPQPEATEAQLKLLNKKTGELRDIKHILYDCVEQQYCGYFMNPTKMNSYDRFIRLKEFDQGDHLLAVSWCHFYFGTNVFAGWIDTKNSLIHCRQAFGNDDYPDGLFVRYNEKQKCMSVYTSRDEPIEKEIYKNEAFANVLNSYNPPMNIERFHQGWLGWINKEPLCFIPLKFPKQPFISPSAGTVQLNDEYEIRTNSSNGKVQLLASRDGAWSDLDYKITKTIKEDDRTFAAKCLTRYDHGFDVPEWYKHVFEPQDRLLLIPSLTHEYKGQTWYFVLQFIEKYPCRLKIIGANVCPETKKVRWSHKEEDPYGCNFVIRYYHNNNNDNAEEYILIAADRDEALEDSVPFPFNCSQGCVKKIVVSRNMTVLSESDLDIV